MGNYIMAQSRNIFHFFAAEYEYIYPLGEVKMGPMYVFICGKCQNISMTV